MFSLNPSQQRSKNMLASIQRNQKQQKSQTEEQQFLSSISQIVNQIIKTLKAEKEEFEAKTVASQRQHKQTLEKQEQAMRQLRMHNEKFKHENIELKVKLDQSLRSLQRTQLKMQLLDNKIKVLSDEVAEKDAIIKYLQGKNHENSYYLPKKTSNGSFSNPNMSLEESTAHYLRSTELSFAKLKQTKLKFQNYAKKSILMFKESPDLGGQKNKTKRIRTQSSHELKQNRNQDNLNQGNNLATFMNSKHSASSNDKTLAKKVKHKNSSCWIGQNSKAEQQISRENANLKFNHSTYFYKPEHASFYSELSMTMKQNVN